MYISISLRCIYMKLAIDYIILYNCIVHAQYMHAQYMHACMPSICMHACPAMS